ncbi:sensor histidine kinase [Flavisolibacter ginsenosidimutans]|uniref:histidine kinase n=1 Tax=Flavisolibacter ginsenosidimutans TaxID=661481 RepID=A0A5B8UKZ0_9BACT|nr:ATP-binding protein [Flavisolibacter ginsenosidimutans]QEC56685.1 hypothetical protein FSB75_12520 [Flavisolibacter ginsenosidimutans]
MDARETSLYIAILITGVAMVSLTLYFAASAIWHQRKHARIQRQNFLDEIGLLEKERARVARDLHDELAPLLSLTRFQLMSVRESNGDEVLQRASANLQRVMLRMGEIAVDLNAGALVQKGLRFALTDFFLELEGLSSLRIRFCYDVRREIPAQTGIHLYRIVQEAVHNAFKHSGASQVDVHVKERLNQLFLYVGDNGTGFRCREASQEQIGIGLQSIRSRTGMLGGRLECRSSAQKGTTYFFQFPFPSKTSL